jgi:hypothetical protein
VPPRAAVLFSLDSTLAYVCLKLARPPFAHGFCPTGATVVFVCTDGTPGEKAILRANLAPVRVEFLEEDLGHPGINAITEQWIAARANSFIGTAESRWVGGWMIECWRLGNYV